MTQQVIVDTLIDEGGNEVHLYMDVEIDRDLNHFFKMVCAEMYAQHMDITADEMHQYISLEYPERRCTLQQIEEWLLGRPL